LIARTVHEAAAVQPDHHWPFPPISEPGSPQVEHQAVFVLLSNAVWSKQSRGVEARRLHAGWSILRGIAHTRPWRRGSGRQEAVAPAGGCSIGNTLERVDSGRVGDAPNPAADGLNDRFSHRAYSSVGFGASLAKFLRETHARRDLIILPGSTNRPLWSAFRPPQPPRPAPL